MPFQAASASCWRPEETDPPTSGGTACVDEFWDGCVEGPRMLRIRSLSLGLRSSITETGPGLYSGFKQEEHLLFLTIVNEKM